MDSEELRELYQEMILGHNRAPRNKGRLEHPDREREGFNPLCGDQVTITLALDGDRIQDIRFDGHGCAIDTASASMMTEAVKGKSKDDARRLFDAFHHLVMRDAPPDDGLLGKLTVFAGVGEFPARVKCATLPWHTMKAALEGEEGKVTTE